MNWNVEWTDEALDDLAAVWTAAPDKAEVTAASFRIEALLAAAADGAGESRADDDRLVIDGPIAVGYRVEWAGRVAVVTACARFGRPRP